MVTSPLCRLPGILVSLRAALGCAALCAFLVLGACSSGPGLGALSETSREWPMGTEGGRVVWVKEIAKFQDLGLSQGFWTRVQELISGEEDHSIVRPYGVLHDTSGRLYLADPGGGVVHCLDLGRGRYSSIGGAGSPLRTPIGLAEDDRGRLYITDSTSGTVYRYTPEDGSLKPFLAGKFKRPTGIAFHPRNKLLYIVDTLESQIVAVDQDGIEKRRMGVSGDGSGPSNRPTDITIDAIGQIYVTDSLNFRITVLTPEGQLVRHIGAVGDAPGYFSRPKGVAVDSAGHVYVCDALLDAIQVFDTDGSSLLVFGRTGNGRGQFWMPSGLFIDRNDFIFVADTYNRRIQVFRYRSTTDSQNGSQ